MSNKDIRVRFAPSPTGPFTIGSARATIFNWVFAKSVGGEFLLRTEDTDEKRSKKEFEDNILDSLRWLELDWDGDVYKQSERGKIYEGYTGDLLDKGDAYYCFCPKEELDKDKEEQIKKGIAPRYVGRCANIDQEEAIKRVEGGEDHVIRIRTPDKKIIFNDEIRGRVEFGTEDVGDFVIAKDVNKPLYNLAVVIDDHEMGITHVVRGEDHISNTPRQIILIDALGFDRPHYAHLPLILDPNGGKLSKRTASRSVLDYKKEGYLPEAMFNFLLLIGWHPKKDREVITREEAIKEFSLDRVQKSGGAFNEEKLDWYNAYYIKNKPIEELLEAVRPFMPKDWLSHHNKQFLLDILDIEKGRMKRLTDLKDNADFFFKLPDYDTEILIWKDDSEQSLKSLEGIYKLIDNMSDNLDENILKENLEKMSEEVGGRGPVYSPFRVALSGKKNSPNGLEVAPILGKKEVLIRLKIAMNKLKSNT